MKLGPPPDLEERRAWFKYWNLSESGRLSRAEVLRAILRSFRVSSTDRQKLQELRARVDKVWDLWHSNRLAVQGHADPNFVSCEEFARDGGFGDLLNEMFGLDPGGHDLHPAPTVEASSVSRRHAGQRRQPHGVPSPRGWRPALWDGRPGSAGHLTRPLPGPTAFAAAGSARDGPPPDLEVPSETVAPPGMFEASPLVLHIFDPFLHIVETTSSSASSSPHSTENSSQESRESVSEEGSEGPLPSDDRTPLPIFATSEEASEILHESSLRPSVVSL